MVLSYDDDIDIDNDADNYDDIDDDGAGHDDDGHDGDGGDDARRGPQRVEPLPRRSFRAESCATRDTTPCSPGRTAVRLQPSATRATALCPSPGPVSGHAQNVVNVVEKRARIWKPSSGTARRNRGNRGNRRANAWQAWENAKTAVKTRGRRGKA